MTLKTERHTSAEIIKSLSPKELVVTPLLPAKLANFAIVEARAELPLGAPRLRTKWNIESAQIKNIGVATIRANTVLVKKEYTLKPQVEYILLRGAVPIAIFIEQFTLKISEAITEPITKIDPKTFILEPIFSLEVIGTEELTLAIILKCPILKAEGEEAAGVHFLLEQLTITVPFGQQFL